MGDEPIIFYSWQDDAPNKTNRGLIKNALERAVKALHIDGTIEDAPPRIAEGAQGAPGSSDLSNGILDNIDRSFIVVSDVSIINSNDDAPRKTPNPNVLMEMGYAWARLGVEYVIPVFNKASGRIEELPFDLRNRKIVAYRCLEGDEPGPVRAELTKRLESAIREVIEHSQKHREPTANEKIRWKIWQDVVAGLVMCDHWKLFFSLDGFDGVQQRLLRIAGDLRDAAVPGLEAIDSDQLFRLADMLGRVGRLSVHMAVGKEIDDALAEARPVAIHLKNEILASLKGLDYTSSARSVIKDSTAELALQLRRLSLDGDTDPHDFAEVISSASNIGRRLLHLSYYDLNAIRPEVEDELREIGAALLPLSPPRYHSYDEGAISKPIAENLRRLEGMRD